MAKRGGSELNHDNWDREDEKEDAGSFQAATADAMKGRVIKRARRRNIGEDGAEKKNAFASFGGFGGKPEAPSFSFGAKSGSESTEKPSGFAGFGLSQSTEQKSLFGSPAASFGSLDTPKAKTPSFGTDAFSFGSKTPSGGGGTGGGGAFSLSSGTGGFSFGSSGEKKETVFGASIKPLPADPAPPSPVRKEEKEEETAKPGSAAAQNTSFKFGATPAASAPAPAPAPADTGAASLFAFGSAKTTSETPASGFLFGSKTSASSKESSPAFGLSIKSPPSGFAFGETKAATEKNPEKDKKDLSGSSGFVFGKSDSPAKTPSFSFNSEAKKDESPKEVSLASNPGEKLTESRSPASNSKPTSKHSTQYLSHLKALNNQVLAWLKMHIESNPLVILSPVFKDYETHLEEINTKYGASSSSEEVSAPAPKEKEIVVSKEKEQPTKVATEPAKPFSFGSFSTAPTTSTAAASPFSFGSSSSPAAAAAKVENQTSSSSAAFSFSANSTPAVSSFGAFSFGAGVGAAIGIIGSGSRGSKEW